MTLKEQEESRFDESVAVQVTRVVAAVNAFPDGGLHPELESATLSLAVKANLTICDDSPIAG